MSRYQPRIIINNPEKYVPDDIIEQFFLTLKSGNLDNIRNFVVQNKLKYNIIDRGARGSTASSGKTPFHVVLELDNKIANNRTKLEIIKFLDTMGSPIDLPDSSNVWPIHLAASSQSEKIIDFLINKKVSLNRKDSSNNTPLIYAIYGLETSCPKPLTIGSISPPQPIDKNNTNKILTDVNTFIMSQLNNNPIINDNLIHMINTIQNVPKMYLGQKLEQNIQLEIIQIFTDILSDPGYSVGSNIQQTKLEQLIDKIYSNINQDLLKNLISPLTINPNNSGWGPNILTATGTRPPTNLERILETDHILARRDIDTEYAQIKNSIIATNVTITNDSIKDTIPEIINQSDFTINEIVFNPNMSNITYGEKISLTKILFLLLWNNYRVNYGRYFAEKILNSFPVMNINQFRLLIARGVIERANTSDTLYGSTISHLLGSSIILDRNIMDDALEQIVLYYDTQPIILNTGYNSCIASRLINLFTNSDTNRSKLNLRNTSLNQPLSQILNRPEYQSISNNFNILRAQFKRDYSWFSMLTNLIKDIQPVNKIYDVNNDVFVTDTDTGYDFILPNTPLYKPGSNPINSNNYTLLEAFRVIEILVRFLRSGRVVVSTYPLIFDTPISQWNDYVDNISTILLPDGTTISQSYPELIFLYKILVIFGQQQIKKYIESCINTLLSRFNNDENPGDEIVDYKQLFGELDDAYLLSILLPSIPNRDEFTIIADEDTIDPFFDIKQNKWNSNNQLITWFTQFQDKFISNELTEWINSLIASTEIFSYSGINTLRQIIENNILNDNSEINNIINNTSFRNTVRQYFGSNYSTSSTISSNNLIQRYNIATRNIKLDKTYDRNLSKLRNEIIDILTFLTEICGNIIVNIKQRMIKLSDLMTVINNIMADIISCINTRTVYYIPQIFLPALVKQLFVIIIELISIRNEIIQYNSQKSDYISYVDTLNINAVKIVTLMDNYMSKINNELSNIYINTLNIIKQHNIIIEFLNSHSAYQLIRSRRDYQEKGDGAAVSLFDYNLNPILDMPNTFNELKNLELLNDIFRKYTIPDIRYYGNNSEIDRIRHDIFGPIDEIDEDDFYVFDNYRGVIDYIRSGNVSNSPFDGENSQLNMVAYNDNDTIVYDIEENINPISGTWLNFLIDKPENTTYNNAFIAYIKDLYQYKWVNGMPPSIRNFLSKHLGVLKIRIIEETVQYFLDQSSSGTKNLLENIKQMGTGTTYDNVSDVVTYMVIARQTDNIINEIINYTTKQMITEWIYQYVKSNNQIASLIDNNTVNIIREKYFQRISLNQINQSDISKLLNSDPTQVNIKIPQIEPNPDNIKYATGTINPKFINYLYDIDYTSTSNNNSTCYTINPKIVSKLITGENINSKNSDGNTPLHIAITMNDPNIVELLLNKGANKTFVNIHNKNPVDLSIINIQQHIKYTEGVTVIETINNFVIPFNDLLLARLKDERFKNNIIKNITMGIPISIVIYNHLFTNYLQNYRYNFTIELKNSIQNLLKKYFNLEFTVYPIDLFEISDVNKLTQILENNNNTIRANKTINTSIINRTRYYDKQISLLNNQIDNLQKEKNINSDPDQILFIDNIIINLKAQKRKIESKKTSVGVPKNITMNDAAAGNYNLAIKSIKNKIRDRNITLIDFYDLGFQRIGTNNDLYLAIWNDYLNKNINNTPSMIFSLLNKIISNNINTIFDENNNQIIKTELKTELETISKFFEIVRNYIESVDQYPKNLDDNPILMEESKQIIYLINLIITPSIRNIILNQILSGLSEMDPLKTFTNDSNKIIDSITNAKFNGVTLDRYLYDVLPQLAYKYYTTVYNNSDDIDMKITNGNDLYLPIIQILRQNNLINITDDSVLAQNFREYLIPFISNTYHYFIYHVKLARHGYERYIINTHKLIKILQIML
ncbi:ankyrin repeat protein [Megavirus chiliensis]|uniref:Ankyrin repeat protein n=2 Tax=Megamimivirinae TaxID=3044648 RepID=A0A2L2DM52_MIMIV|nr:putative ankyrin repeat protein [Megavirus chiliensis]AEQ33265.1 ankyrin repeat protein [Megavirus chiliensis]AVG47234.1 ankyrin repeat protein [Acanthamoeba polyphaga mimivirus]